MSINYNNILRDGFLTGLEMVPEIGGLCRFLANMLWPADQSNPFDVLQKMLEQLAVKIENEVWIIGLKGKLNELRAVLKRVQHPESPRDKIAALNLLYSTSGQYYDLFVNPKDAGGDDGQPQNTVALLVAFGTLRLAALIERVTHYNELVGDDPVIPPVDELRQNLAEMSRKVTQDRDRALQWRQGMITLSTQTGTDIGNFKKYHNYTVSDTLDPSFGKEFSAEDGSENNPTSRVYPQVIQYMNNQRFKHSTLDDGYASNLDQLLDAARFWKYSDPATPLVTTPGSRYWCNMIGGAMRTGTFFNHKALYIQHGDITRLQWWWDNGALKGIQVYYGGVPSGIHGKATGSNGDLGIDPSSNGFTWMGFSAKDWVERFTVDINSRRFQGVPVAGRGDCGSWWGWTGRPSLSAGDPRLAYIAGVTNGDVISQLKVVWKTGESYTTDLPKQHTADAIDDDPNSVVGVAQPINGVVGVLKPIS